jgi:hypothetical protein
MSTSTTCGKYYLSNTSLVISYNLGGILVTLYNLGGTLVIY